MYIRGIDVSKYQSSLDWISLARSISFAFVKVSQANYTDPAFAGHWAGSKQGGLLRGGYHYLTNGFPGKLQAQAFLAGLGSDQGELPPVVDLEDRMGDRKDYLAKAQEFLAEVEAHTKHKPIIYTAAWYWNEIAPLAPWASQYPLWTASYPYMGRAPEVVQIESAMLKPRMPAGWKDWKFWQYSDSGVIPGAPKPLDVDVYHGTLGDLVRWLQEGR